ncbi:transcriptional regulator [Zhengella mangrovi]|uniref:Transcriptional regulator n=1 Tax=Zhengella mangrovi TaxID=1982044 RepID=A0A2G1QHG9_9HYPH|nr:winged helix-turn-helix domain-containing protein [Zhengella mangrovi]PHP64894.1 transcriptional regulator [Zhengella mangrovi]
MIYRFGDFTLDLPAAELRRSGGAAIAVERQVFLLLVLLVRNGHRLTTHNEIVETVWNGAAISDATISSRIRSARAAIGDDGTRQQAIRTLRGRGFRFEMAVTVDAAPLPLHAAPRSDGPETGHASERSQAPSIAVLRFSAGSQSPHSQLLGTAIAHELIVTLSRMKWLTVIARGSSFQFSPVAEAQNVGQRLDVRYLLSGRIEERGGTLVLAPLLTVARSGEVIWADRFEGPLDDVHLLKEEVARAVVTAAEIDIPRHEARLAQQMPSEALDAWAHYHLGLNHIYRFTEKDNEKSAGHFSKALALAPDFARAHAGMSFVAFQRAFSNFDGDSKAAAHDARTSAERAMELAPGDPLSNFVLGRSYWVLQDPENACSHLERAVALNPSYAQGHYSLGLVQALAGNSEPVQAHADAAIRLSPIDPLLYGMHGMRAWAALNAGDWSRAAFWASKSARTPGAHYLVDMLAASVNAVAGESREAAYFAERTRRRRPDANLEQFISAFVFPGWNERRPLAAALQRLGF